MAIATVGILSPGDMGHTIGKVLREGGLRVVTCLEGRSARTGALAAGAGIEPLPTLEALVAEADFLLSVLVPAEALGVAQRVAGAIRREGSGRGADLLYADCNAIAPRTALAVAETVGAVGARFADVGIIGPPPRGPATRFYASGPGAAEFARLGDHGLHVRLLDGPAGQASGFKMCYGALTKGLQALGTELLVAARLLGLEEALAAEQRESVPILREHLERAVPTMPPKAYRWVGEMEEIATCFADLGLTPQLFLGAADLYRFVADTPIGRESPEGRDRGRGLDGIVAELAGALEAGAGAKA
ncbi:MAG: 3-hydroxyisobutyrate dehydrogenase family protein [uncultured Thermomicrobiales bacterium]|uniref:3-hydroxyisobutyrate dehydrogenase family protein n=1 Tax=uncultured Thermomicrobiales bacterium TaxID=1645740 RepID=A0A6J4UWC8_9BACT|nr:MAG: 3-hydroxyisobutyrate dehydrogenase family protein [uncultured Thermomicrobiales bacterium]